MAIEDVTSSKKFSQPRFKSFRDNSDPNYHIRHYLRTYLKRFQAELAEVEKPDGKLAIMTFKQGLYVHSPLSQKLNKGKHDYATLAEFFDIIDALTD
ncbi:hypothetical protein D8674_020578 [Pyrus ussuriensis x Pyrus communis]|uniref:Uncharacterized protein n=1 Tax=Pyrus ussuriensis x Pyrus communis TaxID=2448454 RepID=A0A5N5HN51_9ROSA|nr:hypothetical protein D8674_020578 [Pyrus ussuriensis x Pyrus communis]